MAIEVGDAVLRFLGNTTALDTAFDEVGPKAKAAFAPAENAIKGVGDAADDAGDSINKIPSIPEPVPESAKLTAREMREARGEARLLGEELGIRLPRHVSNFVAELPGVGGALSAAFSATAVLILIKALAEGAEKLSDFIGATFIFTKAMKEAYSQLVAENLEIAKQAGLYDAAARSLKELTDLRTPYEKLQDVLKEQNAELDRLAFKQGEYARTTAAEDQARARALQEQIQLTEAQIVTQALADKEKNNADTLKSLLKEIALRKQLAEVSVKYNEALHGLNIESADEIRYQISLKALQAQAAAEAKYGKDNINRVREINAQIESLQVEHTLKTTEELNREKDNTIKILDDMQKTVKASDGVEIVLPKNIQTLLDFRAEAQALGVTLATDLVEKVNLAKKALNDYTEAGGKDAKQIEVLKTKLQELEKEYDKLGQVQDKEKLKSETTWAGFVQDVQKGISVSHELSVDMQAAFNSFSGGLQNAFQLAIQGEKGFGKALEESTAKALESLAAQAAVKALFYTAEGFAELALGITSSSATELFTAAGIMASVAGAAGLAGRGIGGAAGGGGSTPSTIQQNGSSSNTSSSGGGGVRISGVQGFADGGLVMGPTLALVGEKPGMKLGEAVLPLDDEHTMERIGAKVAKHVAAAGGGGMNVNVGGTLISDATLIDVMKRMSKLVSRGQATFQASHSLRINKRSA